MQIITGIVPDSIAEELEMIPGSRLISINGLEVEDIFDYRFLVADTYVELEVEEPSGETVVYEIEKDYEEEIGLIFGNGLMDEYRRCSNNCIFCFIDQMPGGMRPTLYFKDDDSRLSFLQGNYITLTNMKEKDIDRIIRYRMSPINISVHTTDPDLRCRMLNNRFAGDVLKYIDRLYEADIKMNAQVVLCKGINDGEALRKTVMDLSKYLPVMESMSVVPVGLTKYREGLFPLEPVTPSDASDVIDMIEELQTGFYEKYGLHFVHASDEFYLLAEREVPEEERYDGYLQLENGVGMIRLLREQFYEALEDRIDSSADKTDNPGAHGEDRHITIATGKLAYGTLCMLISDAESRLKAAGLMDDKTVIDCISIRNDFFGETITVSGLICGCDIINQLKERNIGSELLIPVNMLRSGEKYFLDDVTVSQIEQELGVRIVIVPRDGEALLKAVMGEEFDTGDRQIYEQADSCDSWKA